MLGDFASLDVQNTYRGSDAYGETRSDQLLEHLAFLLARLAVRLNGTPQSILKVFIVTGLLLAVHKKNELTLSKVKLFDKFQRRQKC
ncbi:hypothetical protein AVI51_15790 (plasmid) [Piscirickettsia salmonis]|nr:hypothetical protein AVI48_17090 [Piscirickettsia salmonis]APS49120.1 hypothetical protein AVI49_15765 [Piscirickettsia salmonis]APS52419.1 hypothetical protein AVI50_16355 [Piscirickettsia salmonis]APS55570.1 hypothetical protein AVI51_15790 [Piscirickettsia salmonis]APS58880.1 hypothetical protein AVI52_16680 [Piscirickettsia salmonis]